MKIGYIIPLYFGGPRSYVHPNCQTDTLFYIKTQFQFIEKLNTKLDKVYVIFAFDSRLDADTAQEIRNNLFTLCSQYENVVLRERKNLGGSYCSWEYALDLDNGKCDFIFLTEDDYVLWDPNVVEEVLTYFNQFDDLLYLCQWWKEHPYTVHYGNIHQVIPVHAAMSAGIINNKMYHKLKIERNLYFKLVHEEGYQAMYANQAMFLENYRQNGIHIRDWREVFSSYFPHDDVDYGNANGLKVLVPITEKFF
jgi:hypothetical protein